MNINIAIDGPSATGKSSVADLLAQKLGYVHLDTGSMYRAVAYYAIKKGIKLDQEDLLVDMIANMALTVYPDGKIFIDGHNISEEIRTNEISMAASDVSKLAGVRKALVLMQQNIAKDGGYILDGRDIGTVVLKDAEVKLFLSADSEDRAMRRHKQNLEKGLPSDYATVLAELKKRDYQDENRECSPLRQAEDAINIDTSKLTIDEVVSYIMEIVKSKLK